LLTFKKLQGITTDLDLVRNSINLSTKLVLSPDRTKIKRIEPFTPLSMDQIYKKSLFVSGFPSTLTTKDIENLFAPNQLININRHKNGRSARVEFKDEDEVNAIIKRHTENPIQFENMTLLIRNYLNQTQEQAMKDALNSFKKTNKRKKVSEPKDQSMTKQIKKKKLELSNGSIMQFVVTIPSKKLKFAFMQKLFEKHGKVSHLDCPAGGQLVGVKCFVRFQEPHEAYNAFTQLSGEYKDQIEFTLLNEQETKQYEEKINKLLVRKSDLIAKKSI
jgi:vacuolar-type H+-ATPase subunit F/Vma7